jgi:hypothetical protein
VKRANSIFIGAVMSLLCLNSSSWTVARPPGSQDSTVKLYAAIKYGEQRKSCINFKTSAAEVLNVNCDFSYGPLNINNELDWFQSSTAQSNRSVIKDLGEHEWLSLFEVPEVEPLTKLKPGEQRKINLLSINVGAAPEDNSLPVPTLESPAKPSPKTSPLFVKAITGHVYVIHVVDESRDFYALVRVEALQRGDNCTVSWKLIPAPLGQTGATP